MKNVWICLLAFLLAFALFSCSRYPEGESSIKDSGAVDITSISPDMVIDSFKFREISQDGVDVEFGARRALYYRSVDFISFEDVEGVFRGEKIPYHFELPEAMYDSGMKSLISSGKVFIAAADVFRLTGVGGVFDFEKNEARLDRDIVLRSGTLSVTGERGVMDFGRETFRLEKVSAIIEDIERLKEELQEVVQ